ncbi:superoxide dismutase family protein [Lentzea sp. JNUCC 0626]|uniref:superoxide dismutase family protein n=1 Tax=Lentzea sp. JNUCC 0626 TaxID=3367513 RepID=UPI003747B95C
MRTSTAALVSAVLLAGLTACSDSTASSAGSSTPTSITGIKHAVLTSLLSPEVSTGHQDGFSYDARRVPQGAKTSVGTSVANGRTTVGIEVAGLLPNTKYGSHVHTKPCGAKPADSGPHYQNEKDPVTPSTDPTYANAENEIWLDFTTDAQGSATSTATVNWEFRKDEANSVVIHASHTSTEHGKAGTAGERVACLTGQF